ncbi:MAG TPA: ABC transporter permease subunit [Euzebya sp.]|nr:ABC transporter permease subunit [Euzebya sp.]
MTTQAPPTPSEPTGAVLDPDDASQGAGGRRDDHLRTLGTLLRRLAIPLAALGVVIGGYLGYKALGRALGDPWRTWPVLGGWLPATDDLIMPPLGDVWSAFGAPAQRGSEDTLLQLILQAAGFTLREAAVGFVVGLVIGLVVAIVLLRARTLEQGLLPWVIASQTIPLVAIAPIVVIWGRGNLSWLPWEWQDWMSVSLIATYLTFFPVAVNGLRGLQSPAAESVELMRSCAATWTQTLRRLRFPAALPLLFTGMRVAATASVVGAIVGEISAGVPGGLGRMILDFASRYTTGPERLYAAVLGAALAGLVASGVIVAIERVVLHRRGMQGASG